MLVTGFIQYLPSGPIVPIRAVASFRHGSGDASAAVRQKIEKAAEGFKKLIGFLPFEPCGEWSEIFIGDIKGISL